MSISATPTFEVPSLSPTDRLVCLPAILLKDARTGQQPRLRTTLRLGLRDGALLVRFDARDRGVVATLTKRDAPLWKEDVFEVFLSPFHPPLLYFEFEVNPLGALFDARVESPGLSRSTMRVEESWTCSGFSARARRVENRWSARLRIPLSPMVEGEIPILWRANFFRIDRGPFDEFSAWSPTYADPADFHVPERFGYLRFGRSALSSQP